MTEERRELVSEIASIAAEIKDGLSRTPWNQSALGYFGTSGLPRFLKGVEALVSKSRAYSEQRGDSGMIEYLDDFSRRIANQSGDPDLAATAFPKGVGTVTPLEVLDRNVQRRPESDYFGSEPID